MTDHTRPKSLALRFPGGPVVLVPADPAKALANAKEWIALARASTDLVYIASALDRAAAALELVK
jgi:hypothetical protein